MNFTPNKFQKVYEDRHLKLLCPQVYFSLLTMYSKMGPIGYGLGGGGIKKKITRVTEHNQSSVG